MKSIDLYIRGLVGIITVSMLLSAGCEQYNSPQSNPKELKIKKETVWNCDILTEQKTTIHSIKEYDRDGKLILWEEFNDRGAKQTELNYVYEDYKSIEFKKVFKPTGEIDSISTSSIIYDNSGKILTKIIQSPNGDTLSILNYSYDKSGNILKKVEINPNTNSQIETVYTYQYNSEGNIIERLINPRDNGFYQSKDSLIYKPSESTVERIYYESYGQISSIYTYFYNNLGQIVKEYKKDSQGNVIKKYIYEYIYW